MTRVYVDDVVMLRHPASDSLMALVDGDQTADLLALVPEVEVEIENLDGSPVDVYDDKLGGSPLAQPFTVTDGRVQVYLDEVGTYRRTETADGFLPSVKEFNAVSGERSRSVESGHAALAEVVGGSVADLQGERVPLGDVHGPQRRCVFVAPGPCRITSVGVLTDTATSVDDPVGRYQFQWRRELDGYISDWYRDLVMADAPLRYWRLADESGSNVAVDEMGVTNGDYEGVPEVQQIRLVGTVESGTFTLDYDGQVTAELDSQTVAGADIQAALEALSNLAPGDLTVAGSVGGPWQVTFDPGFPSPETLVVDNVDLAGNEAGILVEVISGPTLEVNGPPTGPRLGAHFDGTDPGQWMQTAAELLTLGNDMAMELWFRPDSDLTDIAYLIGQSLADTTPSTTQPELVLWLSGGIKSIRARANAAHQVFTKLWPGAWRIGHWNLVTYSRTDLGGGEYDDRIFVNGWAPPLEPSSVPVTYVDATVHRTIGRRAVEGATPVDPFPGAIAEVAIYDHPLSLQDHRDRYGIIAGYSNGRSVLDGDGAQRDMHPGVPFYAETISPIHSLLGAGDRVYLEVDYSSNDEQAPPLEDLTALITYEAL